MGVAASALGAIGGTPLIQLRNVVPAASAGVLAAFGSGVSAGAATLTMMGIVSARAVPEAMDTASAAALTPIRRSRAPVDFVILEVPHPATIGAWPR